MFCKAEVFVRKKPLATKVNCIYVDRPGYGGSDAVPKVSEWSYRMFAKDMEQLADQLGIATFYVAGHSSGGPCALACGAHLPQRVSGIVSLAGDAEYATKGAPKDTFGGGVLGWLLAKCFIPAVIPIISLGGLCGPFSLGGAKADYRVEREPYDFRTESIGVPTLFVHGDKDTVIPMCSEFTHKRVHGSELMVIPGASHQSVISRENLDLTLSRILQMAKPSKTD